MMFFVNSFFLGVGLAMDAFSVSLANGLNEPNMKTPRICLIAGIFSLFQFVMPMLGWFCVHTIAQYFSVLEKFIPWISLVLLCFIGANMIKESKSCDYGQDCGTKLVFSALIIQGVATSIDALSVGFTVAEYDFFMALSECLIIGIVTFFICFCGIVLGKKFGTKLSGKAGLFGGIILIAIGIEIFLTGIF